MHRSKLTHDQTRAIRTSIQTPQPRRRGRPRTALTDDQIRSIFTSDEPAPAVALKFKVSPDTIYSIRRRLAYTDVTSELPSITRSRRGGRPRRLKPPKHPINSKQIVINLSDEQIRSIYTSSIPVKVEAQNYGVEPSLIRSIRDRSIFAYVTMNLRRPIKVKPVRPEATSRGPHRRTPTTPGIDFAILSDSHRNLERPRQAVGRVRVKPGYKGAKEIIAYLIPLNR